MSSCSWPMAHRRVRPLKTLSANPQSDRLRAFCAAITRLTCSNLRAIVRRWLIEHSIHKCQAGRPARLEWRRQKMSLLQQTPRSIEIVPLTLHIGAEIRGVDLTKPLPPQQVKEVRDAFLKWKVVFFRNQHLDHAQHRDVAGIRRAEDR